MEVTNAFLKFASQTSNRVGDKDFICIQRSLTYDTRIPATHGLGKLHEAKLNLPARRLIVSAVGSPLHIIGRWLGTPLK